MFDLCDFAQNKSLIGEGIAALQKLIYDRFPRFGQDTDENGMLLFIIPKNSLYLKYEVTLYYSWTILKY